GEFFMDVNDITDSTRNMEFIAPPYLYALEVSADSLLWCKGTYIKPAEVADAFHVHAKQLPKKTGLGYTEPIIGNFRPDSLVLVSVLIALFMIALEVFFNSSSQDREVFHDSYTQAQLKDQKFYVTPAFNLDGGSKNLKIYITSPLSQDWFFAEFSLINEATG